MEQQKKKYPVRLMVLIIFALVVLFWGISLVRCEILTSLHYDEFKEAYQRNTMLSDRMETFKILNYTDTSATIYYIGEGYSGGDILEFNWKDEVWHEEDWRTIWSASGGTASEVIWPYWWHFIYGGF